MKITLCADDYGMSPSVNQGIIHLLEKGVITATSCLTNLPLWPAAAAELKALKQPAAIGLHLNLTWGKALTPAAQTYFSPLKTVLRRAYLRQYDAVILRGEIRAQIEAFRAALGRLPAFIDGHQHIQQFPQIREALLQVYCEYYPEKSAYMRVSAQPTLGQQSRSFKMLILALLGGRKWRKMLQRASIPHNTSFTGIYNFDPKADYAKLFQSFIKQSQDGGIIMCHPGLPSEDVQDEIYRTRGKEYAFFSRLPSVLDL
jgi:predicted glycoside hydrolase/deacetylase ChbG (UPF0249 family)